MSSTRVAFVLLFLSILAIYCATINGEEEGPECSDIVTRALGAIENAVAFFSREYKHVNLDALLGLRMAEGQLNAILQTIAHNENGGKSPAFNTKIINKLDRIRQEADDICKQAIPHVKRNYPQDYNHLGQLVTTDGFWDTNSEPRLINKRLLLQPLPQYSTEMLQEKTSDDCFAELLGSSKTSRGVCSISTRCWDLMSAPGYGGYSLTHQILYFQIGLKMKCTPTIKKRFINQTPYGDFSSVSMLDALCASEFHEAKNIAEDGFPQDRQDLFLEQGLLCGLLGYQNFYHEDWLNEILSWQANSGCFKNPNYVDKKAKDLNLHLRSKRREKVVTEDGCLSHKTSVALGFLTTYIRLLLELNNGTLANCFTREQHLDDASHAGYK